MGGGGGARMGGGGDARMGGGLVDGDRRPVSDCVGFGAGGLGGVSLHGRSPSTADGCCGQVQGPIVADDAGKRKGETVDNGLITGFAEYLGVEIGGITPFMEIRVACFMGVMFGCGTVLCDAHVVPARVTS